MKVAVLDEYGAVGLRAYQQLMKRVLFIFKIAAGLVLRAHDKSDHARRIGVVVAFGAAAGLLVMTIAPFTASRAIAKAQGRLG
jgi:hypothetical protein